MEYEESLGLNLYEMDLRSYDPAIGRFNGIDPVVHHSQGTSVAFDNNPIYWADPSGADAQTFFNNGSQGFKDAFRSLQNQAKTWEEEEPDDWYFNSETNKLEWHDGSNADAADNLTWVGTNSAPSEYLSQISKIFGGTGDVPFAFGLYWSGIKQYAKIRGEQIASGKIFGEALVSAVPGKGLLFNTEAYANNARTVAWLYETDFGNAEYAYYGGQFTGALAEAAITRKAIGGLGRFSTGGSFLNNYKVVSNWSLSKNGNRMFKLRLINKKTNYHFGIERHSFNTNYGRAIFTTHLNFGLYGNKHFFLNPFKAGKVKL